MISPPSTHLRYQNIHYRLLQSYHTTDSRRFIAWATCRSSSPIGGQKPYELHYTTAAVAEGK